MSQLCSDRILDQLISSGQRPDLIALKLNSSAKIQQPAREAREPGHKCTPAELQRLHPLLEWMCSSKSRLDPQGSSSAVLLNPGTTSGSWRCLVLLKA